MHAGASTKLTNSIVRELWIGMRSSRWERGSTMSLAHLATPLILTFHCFSTPRGILNPSSQYGLDPRKNPRPVGNPHTMHAKGPITWLWTRSVRLIDRSARIGEGDLLVYKEGVISHPYRIFFFWKSFDSVRKEASSNPNYIIQSLRFNLSPQNTIKMSPCSCNCCAGNCSSGSCSSCSSCSVCISASQTSGPEAYNIYSTKELSQSQSPFPPSVPCDYHDVVSLTDITQKPTRR